MRVASSVLELIGRTPLVALRSFPLPPGTSLWAKLEVFNPGGSVKDRIALALLEAAEADGRLRPGGTVIEPTAGNTGIGLALAARQKGYRVIFTVPEKFSLEKQTLMRALGAEVVNTPTADGMRGAIAKARELAASIPGAFVPNQFENPANPEAHYRTTGPEIWEQTGGRVTHFVAGAGTGGTFTGAARYLKERNPAVRAVVVEPEGSILRGGEPGPHRTEGIGVEFIPATLDLSLADGVVTVRDDDAFATVHHLGREEGLIVGSSSGAACWAAVREARAAPPGSMVVTIFPDSGERYLSQGIYRPEAARGGAACDPGPG